MNLPTITVVELHRKSSDNPGVESAPRGRSDEGICKCTGCLSLSNSLLIIISFFVAAYYNFLSQLSRSNINKLLCCC
jgi:hypothetical protein